MLDFIFLTGPSGVGKTKLAKGLFQHLQSTYIEQHMVPEFLSRDGQEPMTGLLEEKTCWENTKAMALCFHRLGYRNVIVSDLDDLRTADLPVDFKGMRFLTLKLVCCDEKQLHSRMQNRPSGLVDFELQQNSSRKILARPLLPNEVELDTTGLSEAEVLQRALEILETFEPQLEYAYEKPPKEWFYSWVFENGLR